MEHTTSDTSHPSSFVEWMKPFNGTARNLSHDMLFFAASCLQDHADYMKQLADASNPADAMKCQLDFAQRAWTRYSDGAWRLLKAYGNGAPPTIS